MPANSHLLQVPETGELQGARKRIRKLGNKFWTKT
jgi:hypothetical protein